MTSLETLFTAFFSSFPFSQKRGLLIAFSGGIDSVVLSDLCARFLKGSFALAYFNHRLRGEKEQKAEKELVTALADAWGVSLFYGEVSQDLKCQAQKERKSLEELAREERYRFLFSIKKGQGFDYLATAHHADDQLETFLMRLSQRSSWASLRGIAPKRNSGIIRPLLKVYRSEIEEYAKKNKLQFWEDSSNASTLFLRNRFRHILLPAWQSVLPCAKHSLLDWQGRLSELYEWVLPHLPCWQGDSQALSLPLKDWLELPLFLKKELVLKGIEILYQRGSWVVYPKVTAKFLDTLERKRDIGHLSILLKGHSILLSVCKDLIFLKPLLVQNKKISYLLKVNLCEGIVWLKGKFYLDNYLLEDLLLASYDRRWDFWLGSRKEGKKFFSCCKDYLLHEISLLICWGEIIALWHNRSACFLWKKENLKEKLKFLLYREGASIGAQ